MHHDLSHGIRSPLTSVLGYTSTMIDQWESIDEEKRREFVKMVYSEALRMLEGVEQIDRRLYQDFAQDFTRHNKFQVVREYADAS